MRGIMGLLLSLALGSAVDMTYTCHLTFKDHLEMQREGRLDALDSELEEAHPHIEAHQEDL